MIYVQDKSIDEGVVNEYDDDTTFITRCKSIGGLTESCTEGGNSTSFRG